MWYGQGRVSAEVKTRVRDVADGTESYGQYENPPGWKREKRKTELRNREFEWWPVGSRSAVGRRDVMLDVTRASPVMETHAPLYTQTYVLSYGFLSI